MVGYRHPGYAASLIEIGAPRLLPRSGGWILERRVPGSDDRDGIGCYPLLACNDWGRLGEDLDELDLVSVTAVADPFGDFDEGMLKASFRNLVRPYKDHFVVDLHRDPSSFINDHHRRNARRALERVTVKRSEEPVRLLDDWVLLYANLVRRRGISGITAFSRNAFSKQLEVPGLVAFRAEYLDRSAGMTLWYADAGRAYYHLGAYSAEGYEVGASFALFLTAIDYFAQTDLRWLSLGAGAGVHGDDRDGLSRFKRGWATGTRQSFLCGRICDPGRYEALVSRTTDSSGDYFPAYRAGASSAAEANR